MLVLASMALCDFNGKESSVGILLDMGFAPPEMRPEKWKRVSGAPLANLCSKVSWKITDSNYTLCVADILLGNLCWL